MTAQPQPTSFPQAIQLSDLRNVGKATLADFAVLGIETIAQLRECEPDVLYLELQRRSGQHQDPCVWDVFTATWCVLPRLSMIKRITASMIFAVTAMAHAQGTLVDVTKLKAPEMDAPASGTGSLSSPHTNFHSRPLPLPMELGAIRTETPEVLNGDKIIVEFSVWNRGTQVIAFPQTLNWRLLDRPDSVTAMMSVNFEVRPGQVYKSDPIRLLGSGSIPGSVIPLKPGQAVRIRAAFRAYVPEIALTDPGQQGTAKVIVRSLLYFPTGPMSDRTRAECKETAPLTVRSRK